MKTNAPLSGLARLTIVGLVATGIGFLGAGVNPGPGPRAVQGALTVGTLYLPPLLVGLITLAITGLVATRISRMPAVGAEFAAILLLGAATFGSASASFRLTHPGLVIGFTEDSLQLIGEVIAIVAGIAATVQFVRNQASDHRLTS
jgi:hypothetical protein